ncbi:aldehyde dehydrogenase [Sphingomonas gei]|uniref:Aldehyde dehydrogenase n=1 Tax=Sphingomonas gei TaxID=1395960 RepID=A0A4S1X0B5_9SPHN|nr:aldehyde dehydrogenase [Sphingomonas gei]TGX49093.1 aldehyde dehydrogenase [Sphingomonas gei]
MSLQSDSPAPPKIAHPGRFFIDGGWQAPSTDRLLRLINPTNEREIISVAEGVEADIDAAVAAARKAFDEGPWPRMRPIDRAALLRDMHAYLIGRLEDLADSWIQQVGITRGMAQAATKGAVDLLEFYADMGASFHWEEKVPSTFPGQVGVIAHEPVGVVAAIVPWNGPFQMSIVKMAPALLAGCTVILKPSPETPLEAYILAEAAEAVGLPRGVFNVVPADRGASERLVSHPGVDKISFTGSSAAGKRIGAIAADRVARVTLELGGKSAAIVLDDYDVELAAETLASTVTRLSGQICSNLTRILVSRKLHDRFCASLATKMDAIAVGDPYDPATQMGPLAMKRQLDRVHHYIEVGKSEGAELAAGGGTPAHLNAGYFVEPTLFANVDNASTIAQEEIFGPVACAIPYEDLDEAISIANDSTFGLGGAVFTNDAEKAYQVARRVRTGTVGQHGSRTDLRIGYGGFKQSGLGREGGQQGLHNYLETKTIILSGYPEQLESAG